MLEEFNVGIFPPVYSVELLGKEINGILNGSLHSYTQNSRFSKLFGKTLEFIPDNYQLRNGSVTVISCLNPNKITNFATKNCTMVLFKTPTEMSNVDYVLNKYHGVSYNINNYVSSIEDKYTTNLSVEQDFKQQPVSKWLELLNKKTLMLLRMSSLNLWDFKFETFENPLTESTDYLLDFFKNPTVDGESYQVNLGLLVSRDEDGIVDTELIHTLSSETEIEETKGHCLRINYNRKRFIQELDCLIPVTKDELDLLEVFGHSFIKYLLPEKETAELFSLVR